jgi:hypothetical protein
MSQPISIPDPARAEAVHRARGAARGALAAAVAVAGGTAVLGVAGGFAWAALAPRAQLVMVSPHAAAVANAETSAFIAADAMFCLVCLAGGVISGLAGYLLAVRRWGPPAMAGVLLGALAAAFVALWVGQQDGLATFHHLLATLPAGARLRGTLTLGADSALALWPLAAGLMAGCLTALATGEPDVALATV